MIYNLIIIETKYPTEHLNLTKEKFFEELWKWTYEEDLWDFIESESPDTEYLEHYINVFIDENMFHQYEDDEVDCYAFIVDNNGRVHTYNWNQDLIDFVLKKIEEKYGKISCLCPPSN